MQRAEECKDRCQYAVDCAMPEYSCADECQYAERPCPHCFESSGYEARHIPATWYEPAWEDTDYSRPCQECNGTGRAPRPTPPRAIEPVEEEIAF